MRDDILRAIAARRLIELCYQNRVRTVEPHDFGVAGGVIRLLVYQLTAAPARPGRADVGWRLLDVEKITALRVLDDTFRGSRGDAGQKHHAWEVVFARVK